MPTIVKKFSVDSRGTGATDYAQPIPGAQQVKAGTVYYVHDLAELARRMSGVNPSDGRGDVFWFDDCQDQLRWDPSPLAISLTDLTINWPYYKGLCAELQLTPGITDYMVSAAYGTLTNLLGFEFFFNYNANISIVTFRVTLTLPTGTYDFGVRHTRATGAWENWNAAGAWVTIGALSLDPALIFALPMNTIKFVVNPTERRYERLLVNTTAFDLRKRPLQYAAALAPPYGAYLQVGGTSVDPAANQSVFLGCWLLF